MTRATLLLALLLAPGTAFANWAAQGVPVCVGPPASPSSGYWIASVSDGAGGCVAAWFDSRLGQSQIYAQRLDPIGAPLWTLNGVRVAPTGATQEMPKLVLESDGGVLVLWADYRAGHSDVYVQRLTAAGAVAPGWPASGIAVTSVTTYESVLSVLADGADGAYVAWFPQVGAQDWDVRLSRITGSGALSAGWPAAGIQLGVPGVYQGSAVLAGDGSGGAFAVWMDGTGGSQTVRACRVTPAGTVAPGWNAQGLPLSAWAGAQSAPQVVASADHSAIVLWHDERNGEPDIFAQRVAGDGTLLWGSGGLEVCAAAGYQMYPQVCSDGLGGAIAAWSDPRDESDVLAVYAQRLEPGGAFVWVPGGLKVTPANCDATYPMIGPDGMGGAIIAWIDQRTGLHLWDIYAQHVVADGRFAWPAAGLPVCTDAGDQWDMVVVRDAGNGAIITWRDDRATGPGIYAWQVTGLSNVVGNVTGFGWSSPVVPRNSTVVGTWGVVVTPTLDGNAGNTYVNWLYGQEGPNSMPAWSTWCLLDDVFAWHSEYPDNNLPLWWATINQGPELVRGGRHTLTSIVDVGDQVPESIESDNVWQGQFVWSPLPLTRNVPVQRDAPPAVGPMLIPNMDGMQFTRPDLSLAWVVSLAQRATGDDYDLYVYDDYAGSTSGFSNMIGWSADVSNHTDYVVGHYSGTPATLYPAVVLFNPSGGGHNFFVDATDASGRNANVTPADWHEVELPSGRVADVYEMYLNAGAAYGWTLLRLAGESDLDLRVFPPTPGGIYRRAQTPTVSTPYAPGIERLAFTPAETGWHPVVVARTTGDYAVFPAQYTLRWNTGAPVDVPGGAPVAWDLAFSGPAPNPARESAALQYTVPERTAVRLELFDLEGRRVRTLVDEAVDAGPHVATWDCRDAAGARVGSGIYWARFTAQGRTIAKRVTVMW